MSGYPVRYQDTTYPGLRSPNNLTNQHTPIPFGAILTVSVRFVSAVSSDDGHARRAILTTVRNGTRKRYWSALLSDTAQ